MWVVALVFGVVLPIMFVRLDFVWFADLHFWFDLVIACCINVVFVLDWVIAIDSPFGFDCFGGLFDCWVFCDFVCLF